MGKNRTPLIRQLRTQGGTLYTFSSATEDIGLNINEKNNRVALSHYALLNIPEAKTTANISEINSNKFNVSEILGAFSNIIEDQSQVVSIPNILIAESFQNYALNLETILLNQDTYNYSLSKTVSERVFWKWLKETGAIRWYYDSSNGYWLEPIDEEGYSQVVQCFGEIFTGAQRSDTFGMYNETYVKIPTSYGQTFSYFKTTPDVNYNYEMVLDNKLGTPDFIVGQDNDEKLNGLSVKAYYDSVNILSIETNNYNLQYQNELGEFVDGWWFNKENISAPDNAYLTDSSINVSNLNNASVNTVLKYQSSSKPEYVFKRSNLDCVSLELNLNNLRNIYNDPTLTFDKIAIENSISTKFEFNTILIYYSIYDSQMKNVLGTNLFGVLFLDSAVSNTPGGTTGTTLDFYIPTFTKKQSTTNGFGTAYSFRLNIKSSSIYDNTNSPIYDESTSESLITSDFNDVIYNLNKSVEILGKNSNLLNTISNNYLSIKNQNIINTSKLIEIEKNINNILGNKFTYLNLESLSTKTIYVENISTTTDSSKSINFIVDNNIIGKIENDTFIFSNFSGGGFTSNSYITSLGLLNTNSISTNNKTSLDIFIGVADASNITTRKNNFRFDDSSIYSKNYIGFVNTNFADSQMIGGNGFNYNISTDDLINDIMDLSVGEFTYNNLYRTNDSSHYGIDVTLINDSNKFTKNLKGTGIMPWMQNDSSYVTFNYNELIPLLVKTIQYLNTRINELENAVNNISTGGSK